jgi:hypothetical protein
VPREWTPEELIESWTLLDDDRRLIGNKASVTRLGFSVLPSTSSWRRVSRAMLGRFRRPRCGLRLLRSRSNSPS